MRVQIRTRTFVHDANLSESEVARESRNSRGGGTSKCRNRVQIRTRIHKGEGEPTMVWGRASTISGCEYECSRLRLHDDQSELVRARVKWRWRHEGKRVGEGVSKCGRVIASWVRTRERERARARRRVVLVPLSHRRRRGCRVEVGMRDGRWGQQRRSRAARVWVTR